MNELFAVLPWLVAMGILILLSALFSGSEAALFSINSRNQRLLATQGFGGRAASVLLADPERLLSAVLFWNLLINMTYFAIAAIVGARLESSEHVSASQVIGFTLVSLMAIIFFSEMLPKSIAVLAPLRISVLIGMPMAVAVAIVDPILPMVKITNRAVGRLIWPGFEPEPEIDLADIERAIELGTEDAALIERERDALRGLVEMAETRADELMRPRSRLTLVTDPAAEGVSFAEIPQGGYLMIGQAGGELIVGAIPLVNLRPSQLDDLRDAIEPVIYVPWSARVSQVWDRLERSGNSVAIVVNEFGDAVGAITIDDVLHSVLLPKLADSDQDNAIIATVQGSYRCSGELSLRILAKHLGIKSPQERNATVAGYLQRHNERYPRLGDTAPLGEYGLLVVDETDDGVTVEIVRPETHAAATSEETL